MVVDGRAYGDGVLTSGRRDWCCNYGDCGCGEEGEESNGKLHGACVIGVQGLMRCSNLETDVAVVSV